MMAPSGRVYPRDLVDNRRRTLEIQKIALASAISDALPKIVKVIEGDLSELQRAFDSQTARRARTKAFAELAERSRTGALEAYESVFEPGGINFTFAQGRKNRYSTRNGRGIRRAIRDKGFVTSDSNGIQYGRQTVLWKHARHWARLNFGTEGPSTNDRAEYGQPFYQLNLYGRRVARIGLTGRRRRAIMLPSAFTVDTWGDWYQIYPARRSRATIRAASGIAPSHFLRGGIEAISRDFEEVMRPALMAGLRTETRRRREVRVKGRA